MPSFAHMTSSSSRIPSDKKKRTPAVSNRPAKPCSSRWCLSPHFLPKCLCCLRRLFLVFWDVLRVIVLFQSTFSSSPSFCVSPPGLHGPMKPLLLHRRNSDSATQHSSIRTTSCFQFLSPSPFVSVYQKCDASPPRNSRRLTKYLCVDMTGQSVVRVEEHPGFKQALNVIDGRFIGVDFNILSKGS